MSWTAKSEKGLKAKLPGTRTDSDPAASMATAAGLAGVRKVVVTWQLLQPTCENSGWPRVIEIWSEKSRGPGASAVMNAANRNTSSCTSVRPPAHDPTASSTCAHCVALRPPPGLVPVWRGARSSQLAETGTPLGADSTENAVIGVPREQLCVVMPISLT